MIGKIIDYENFWKNKKNYIEKYKNLKLEEKYKIKRELYKSKLSNVKKDKIWSYLNGA